SPANKWPASGRGREPPRTPERLRSLGTPRIVLVGFAESAILPIKILAFLAFLALLAVKPSRFGGAVAEEVARTGAFARRPVGLVEQRAAFERETAAADASGEIVAQPFE